VELKAGTQLKSAVGTTEVIVVKPPTAAVELTSGGVPMVPKDEGAGGGAIAAGQEGAILLGKRYVDEESDIEVLCTKAGDGALAVDGRVLVLKTAKPLPSSD
jgi:hypothetical protein